MPVKISSDRRIGKCIHCNKKKSEHQYKTFACPIRSDAARTSFSSDTKFELSPERQPTPNELRFK